jgi:hypothetical protein
MTDINSETIQAMSDEDIREEIACFGSMWNPYDSLCYNECGAQARCLYTLALKHLPQLALEMGHSIAETMDKQTPLVGDVEADEVAAMLGSEPNGIEYAKKLYSNHGMGLPILQADNTLQPSNSGPPKGPPGSAAQLAGGDPALIKSESEILDQEMAEKDITGGDDSFEVSPEYAEKADGTELANVLQNFADSDEKNEVAFAPDALPEFDDGPEEKEMTMTKKTPTKKVVKKKTPTKKATAAKKKSPITKKAPTKKAPTKKVQKKVKLKKKDFVETKAKASTKKVTAKKAPTKKVTAKKGPTKPAAKPSGSTLNPTFASRFERDLQKPYMKDLPWGTVLERKQKDGTTHKVTITKEGFKYGKALYPTLYSVQLEIEGHKSIGGKVQASMSAKRFFGLKDPD